jgi:hypothetical protein
VKTIKPFYRELQTLYRKHFGRDIDRSGYFTYASLLEDGKLNLDAVEKLLVESEEYQNQTDVESS